MPRDFYDPLAAGIKLLRDQGVSLRDLEAKTCITRQKLQRLGKGGKLYAHEIPTLMSALSLNLNDVFGSEFGANFETEPDECAFSSRVNILANQLLNSALAQARQVQCQDITTDDVQRWWHSVGGRLAECDRILPFITAFNAVKTPESPMIAIEVGYNSLPHKSLNTRDAGAVTEYAASLEKDAKLEIASTYHMATTRGRWLTEPRDMEINFRTVPEPFILTHKTTVLPITKQDGKVILFSFSEFIDARPVTRHQS